jgi:hypothetical protein
VPSSHSESLTPTEHKAAELLVILAWRLESGQLVGTEQLLAKLCAIPTNDVAMASVVLLREVSHSMAPVLRRPPIEILDDVAAWLARQPGASS